MRINTTWKTIIIVSLLALASAGCSLASEPIPAGPVETGPLPGEVLDEAPAAVSSSDVPASLPLAGQGGLIFTENCVRCHGAGGTGDGELGAQLAEQGATLPDFTDAAFVRTRTPQDWYSIITNGNMQALMPPWSGSLSDDQRWDAAYYLYRFTATDDVLAQGQTLYEENFADQYGPQGEEIGLDDPATVAALSQADIVDQYIASSGVDLSEDEQWAVAAYMQSFGYDADLTATETADAGGDQAVETAPADQPAEATGEPAADQPAEGDTSAEAAPDNGLGVVSGTVLPGSPDAPLPDGLEVQLSGVSVNDQNAVEEFLNVTQPVSADGTFTFTDVPFDTPRSAYVVDVTYDGVQFSNGKIIEPGMREMDLPVTIYESTTDTSLIEVDAMHLVIEQQPDTLQVTQVLVYSNNGDKIVVTENPVTGGRKGSVAFAVPPEAYGIQFDNGSLGGRYIPMGDRIYDTEQIYPGDRTHSIVVSYLLPFDGRSEFSIPVLYNTLSTTLLIQEGPRVSADLLNEAGVEVIANEAYQKYVSQNLAPGETLAFTVAPAGGVGKALPLIGLAVAGGLLVGGGVFWLVNRRQTVPDRVVEGLSGPQDSLVREMADLDAAFQAGRINRFEWEARRADLKAALAESLEG